MADAGMRPTAKLNAEAWDAGARAHEAGTSVDAVPEKFLRHKPLARAWREGWASVVVEVPAVTISALSVVAPPEVRLHPLTFWPKDKPMPGVYKRPPVPCPTCRRLLTDEGGRAVVLRYTDGGIASFRCKATPGCPTFKLRMEK